VAVTNRQRSGDLGLGRVDHRSAFLGRRRDGVRDAVDAS
jgi:hypothetical protein